MSDRFWADTDIWPVFDPPLPTDLTMGYRPTNPPGERQGLIPVGSIEGGGGPGPGPGGPSELPVQMGFPGIPNPEEQDIVLLHRTVALHESDIWAWCEVNPEATVTFILRQNESQIGTITITSSGPGTVTMNSPTTTFLAGDVVRVEAPSPQDPSMSRILFVLVLREPEE